MQIIENVIGAVRNYTGEVPDEKTWKFWKLILKEFVKRKQSS